MNSCSRSLTSVPPYCAINKKNWAMTMRDCWPIYKIWNLWNTRHNKLRTSSVLWFSFSRVWTRRSLWRDMVNSMTVKLTRSTTSTGLYFLILSTRLPTLNVWQHMYLMEKCLMPISRVFMNYCPNRNQVLKTLPKLRSHSLLLWGGWGMSLLHISAIPKKSSSLKIKLQRRVWKLSQHNHTIWRLQLSMIWKRKYASNKPLHKTLYVIIRICNLDTRYSLWFQTVFQWARLQPVIFMNSSISRSLL